MDSLTRPQNLPFHSAPGGRAGWGGDKGRGTHNAAAFPVLSTTSTKRQYMFYILSSSPTSCFISAMACWILASRKRRSRAGVTTNWRISSITASADTLCIISSSSSRTRFRLLSFDMEVEGVGGGRLSGFGTSVGPLFVEPILDECFRPFVNDPHYHSGQMTRSERLCVAVAPLISPVDSSIIKPGRTGVTLMMVQAKYVIAIERCL